MIRDFDLSIVTIIAILLALFVAILALLYQRSCYFKNNLKWIQVIPSYPILGIAFQFADSTKSLNVMHDYLLKYNGLCYMEILCRPCILISDYRFTEWLLTSNVVLTKSNDYQYLHRWLENGILITGDQKWKKSRKILNPAFHFAILEQFVDVFDKPINVLIELLNKEVDKNNVDIYPYILKFTLDIICQSSMGVQLNVQEGSHSDYVDAVAGMCKIVVERAFSPFKMFDFLYLFSLDYWREKKYVKLLHKVSKNVIHQRKKEIENNPNTEEDNNEFGSKRKMAFLDLLLNYRDELGNPLSYQYIRQEVDTFMFAGHDTTASAISFAIFCLANHSDVQSKALAELKEVIGENARITYGDLQKLKYLELVIKETLRLYPSVPFYSRQTTKDIVYEGQLIARAVLEGKIIPKGVSLAIIAYAINRDPKIYEEPDKFDPTRFLKSDIKPFSYLPFSAGPRNCIGQKFAILEMKSALAKLLLNFEFLPAVPEHHLILSAETVLRSKNGIKIGFRKR